jgi:hypothetical protein
VVHQVFSPDIANFILLTPLLGQIVEDRLIRKVEKNVVLCQECLHVMCGIVGRYFSSLEAGVLVWYLEVKSVARG